ncbi:MAG: hypothetical protein ACTSVV_05470 [Promethearchaeota archaeon]
MKGTPKWDVVNPNFMKNFLDEICETIKDEVVKEILREERNQICHEWKQVWSHLKTKAPFYNKIRGKSNVEFFEDVLEFAQKVVGQLRLPWELSTHGRPFFFSKEKMISDVLMKYYFPSSFGKLKAKLKELRFDYRIAPKPTREVCIPSKSELH